MSRARPGHPPAIRIEAENEWAWRGERRMELAPRAFAVLRHLVQSPGRLITKEELLTAVWRDTIVSDAALSSCIRDLRKALGDSSGAPRYIQTVHRRGFRFIGPVAPPTLVVSPEGSPAPEVESHPQSAAAITAPPRTISTLVGREAELAHLHARLAAALNGQRQLVFVTGEAGIGKTALVEMFLAEVGEANALRIGWGQCVEQYGAGEAYLPVLEALGRLGRAAGGEQLGADPQAACTDVAGAAAGALERSRRGGGTAPGAGSDARPHAARAGGGAGCPRPRRAARAAPRRPALERLGHHRSAPHAGPATGSIAPARYRHLPARRRGLGQRASPEMGQARAPAARALLRDPPGVPERDRGGPIPLPALSRTRPALGAGFRAPPEHGWQSAVSREHDRLPHRPGTATAGGRRPVAPLGPAGGHRVARTRDAVAAGRKAGGEPRRRTSRRYWWPPAWPGSNFPRRSWWPRGSSPRKASYGARRWRDVVSSFGGSASRSGRTGRWPGGMRSFMPCTSRCSTDASPSANG